MRTLLVVILVSLSYVTFAQDQPQVVSPSPYYTITTGDGLYGLNWGPTDRGTLLNLNQTFPVCASAVSRVYLDSGNPEKLGLSYYLPKAFTFEAWVFAPTPANGGYNTIVSRYGVGPFGQYHNKYADFVLQVQTNGSLNFFMGNALADNYGAIVWGPQLRANTWYHVGFVVHTSEGRLNPQGVSLFVDDQFLYVPWNNGQRQERRNEPIVLGDYFNQDGDTKYWEGVLDEVRFWAGERSQDQISNWANAPTSQVVQSSDLLAYYQFNWGYGDAIWDSSSNAYHGFIRSGASNINYVLSGVKVDVSETVNNTEDRLLTLSGLSVGGSTGFTYTILSYPTDAQGNFIGRFTTPEGVDVQYLPFSLLGNQVIYTAPENLVTNVTFQYIGTSGCCLREAEPTTVSILVGEPCPNGYCTRCPNGGAQGTCGCVPLPYFGYTFSEIERILFLFEVEKTLNTLDSLEGKIEQLMTAISTNPNIQDLSDLIREIGDFNTGCLQNFCETFFSLLGGLSQ